MHHGRVAESRLVRDATVEDAAACARIYEPYVRDSAVSFELEPPTAAEVAGRIAAALARHAWVVLEDGGRVVGYAYGGPFNPRAAYDWSTSVSVYTETGRRRTGAGRALYTALLDRLAARGFRTALAGELTHERALAEYYRDLRATVGAEAIWSIDGVHAAYP